MSDYFSNHDLSGLLSFEGEDCLDLFGNGASDQLNQCRKVTSYKTGLFYTFAGCQEKREFRRKYELERHMRKHNPREAYSCPVLECGRHGRQPFYREDKLKAHMETMHCGDEPSACPKAYCQAGVLPFDLLRVHVQSHIIPEGNVFANFLSRSCPVAGCKVKPRLEVRNIPGPRGHLMRYHGPAERAKQHAIITEAGFDSSSGEIICPICRQKSQNQDSFARHLENTHLGQHAAAFERVVRPSISEAAHNASDEFERQSLLNWRV
ncbi:hypothetical protein SLS56_006623 [Neofusicoccum ribis]|uniref:C2H2-type domain-containing protein n=1 Tax=Neofusicoccum ribis TaxID=45134 RepID=A0ABR3SQC4_9PEZI